MQSGHFILDGSTLVWTLRETSSRAPSLAEEEVKSLSVSADVFPFHCTRNLFLPLLLIEKELTAVQINQRDLINLAPAHTSNLETRQAINSANYLLLEVGCVGGAVEVPYVLAPSCPPTLYRHPHLQQSLFH